MVFRTPGGQAVTRRHSGDPGAAQWILVWLGGAFLIVGLVDLALLWVPVRFGNVAWEYATISRTYDSLPLAGLGAGLLAYIAVRSPKARFGWVRSCAAFFALMTLGVVALGLMFVTDVPAIAGQIGLDDAGTGPFRAIVRLAIQAIIYPACFGAVALLIFRSTAGREG